MEVQKTSAPGRVLLGKTMLSGLDLLRPEAGYEQKPKAGLLMSQSLGVPNKRQG